jgi:2-keto-4-pentenoate hydratase/2-oxohepta-3-ene-1,7-dioic acid hydratase in catechol pathway
LRGRKKSCVFVLNKRGRAGIFSPFPDIMRIASLSQLDEQAAVLTPGGWLPLRAIATRLSQSWPLTIQELLTTGAWDSVKAWFDGVAPGGFATWSGDLIPETGARFAPPLRHPRKIWGIGLNYRAHAADLDERAPTAEPASFMKPDTAIIGPGDAIRLPRISQKTTGEAELGIVMGRAARDVPRDRWLSVVAGFTTIIDMTAEDILRRNPRNLTQSKSFDSFFSFGPVIVTPDEIPDVSALTVRTVINGSVFAENTVSNMTFPPDFLVAYHSQIFTWLPGDILSTGTPGAAPLADGDVVACRIDGFPELSNPVVDLKVRSTGGA